MITRETKMMKVEAMLYETVNTDYKLVTTVPVPIDADEDEAYEIVDEYLTEVSWEDSELVKLDVRDCSMDWEYV